MFERMGTAFMVGFIVEFGGGGATARVGFLSVILMLGRGSRDVAAPFSQLEIAGLYQFCAASKCGIAH